MEWTKAAIQLVAIAMMGAGIIYEIIAGAHLGFILVTVGALVAFISTKVKGG